MNVLILEDEKAAATRLQQLLKEVAPNAIVVGVAERIKDALQWLEDNGKPDLVLSDIQLADGLSLEVFRQSGLNVPVIFTTAYDAYALNAFKLNSIDYLLKPIDKDELRTAIGKYEQLHGQPGGINKQLLDLFQTIAPRETSYKSRFLIKQGERLMTIAVDEVAFVRADDKVVWLHTGRGQKHIIDETLDDLETVLDPHIFFRINRTYIAPLASIERISNHFNGRLKINLVGWQDDELYVSRARAVAFKKWLGK